MESKILETLNISPEQLKKYLDKKQKIRDQTNARNKKYKIINAERLKEKAEKIKAEKAQKRQELKDTTPPPKIELNEVVKIPRKYIKKAPTIKNADYVETRGRKRKEKIKVEKVPQKKGPKIKDVNIIDLIDFIK